MIHSEARRRRWLLLLVVVSVTVGLAVASVGSTVGGDHHDAAAMADSAVHCAVGLLCLAAAVVASMSLPRIARRLVPSGSDPPRRTTVVRQLIGVASFSPSTCRLCRLQV